MNGQEQTNVDNHESSDIFTRFELPIVRQFNNDSRTEWVMVSPDVAKKLLGINYERQRRVRDSRVLLYARDMKAGNWNPYACPPIRISSDGKVVDGQHRLHAVIEAGVTIIMKIEYGGGDASELFDYIDNALTRRANQFIANRYANLVTSLSKAILCLKMGATIGSALKGYAHNSNNNGKYTTIVPTRHEIVEYARANESVLIGYATGAKSINNITGANPTAVGIAMFCITEVKNAFMLDEYVDEFKKLAPENRTIAITQATILRKTSQARSQHVTVDRKWVFGTFAYGYDNFVAGNEIKTVNKWKSAFSAYDSAIRAMFATDGDSES